MFVTVVHRDTKEELALIKGLLPKTPTIKIFDEVWQEWEEYTVCSWVTEETKDIDSVPDSLGEFTKVTIEVIPVFRAQMPTRYYAWEFIK